MTSKPKSREERIQAYSRANLETVWARRAPFIDFLRSLPVALEAVKSGGDVVQFKEFLRDNRGNIRTMGKNFDALEAAIRNECLNGVLQVDRENAELEAKAKAELEAEAKAAAEKAARKVDWERRLALEKEFGRLPG